MFTIIWSRISRSSNEMLETRRDQDFRNKVLEKGKREHQNVQERENREYLALLCSKGRGEYQETTVTYVARQEKQAYRKPYFNN